MKYSQQLARSLALPVLLMSCALVVACGGDQPGSQQTGQAAADAPHAQHDSGQQAAHQAPAGDALVIAGISVTVPEAWEDLGPSGMRKAQFRLPAAGSDAEPAEVNVFYFGPASGGGVEANLQRWIGQMTAAPGTEPERRTFEAHGMAGHVVSLDGTYSAGGMRPMGGGGEPKDDYRLVGVVLEGPQGSVFFKLTGPLATARAMETDLMAMVSAAMPAG